MARIRSIKPSFWTNEVLAELSPWHRLCFIGLWNFADREGRLQDRPRKLKVEIFPFDVLDMEQLLAGLTEKGFLKRYVADGAAYIEITHFGKHQRPRNDEEASLIPAPLLGDSRGFVTPQCLEKEMENREGDGEGEGEGVADGAIPAADGAVLSSLKRGAQELRLKTFADAWNRLTEPPIPRCRDLTSARKRHIKSRLTERPLTEWCEVMTRIQASAFCRGDNDRGWRASFDWLIGSPDVGVKVLEGKYDDRRAPEHKARKSWRDNCQHQPCCQSYDWHCVLLMRERGEAV